MSSVIIRVVEEWRGFRQFVIVLCQRIAFGISDPAASWLYRDRLRPSMRVIPCVAPGRCTKGLALQSSVSLLHRSLVFLLRCLAKDGR